MYTSNVLIGGMLALALAGGAVAAESLPDGMRRCAAIADMSVRVACYDKLSGAAPAAVAAPTAAAAPTPAAAPAPATAPSGTGAAAAGTKAVTGAAPGASYGDADLKKSSADRAATAAPKTLDGQVTALHEMAPNVFLITLDNGQIWEQEEARPSFTVRVGDTVRILSGALGAHSMSRLSKGQTSGWVRVTRRK